MSAGSNATERRNHELSVLNAIARELNRSVDLGATLGAALSQAAELLDLRTGWVWLLSEKTGEPHLAASQNLPPGLSESPLLMEGRCYCLDTYEAGDLNGAANVNVVACSRLARPVGGAGGGLKYHASVPLYTPGGKRLGVMNVVSPDWRRLSAEELRLLYTVGDLLSIAVERSRLFEESARAGAAEERNRLAREIHDTLAQGLAAAGLQLESADALLEGHSLPEALRELARKAGRDGLRVSFRAAGAARPLPVRVEAGLYRICQEALENVVQHSRADHARVRLVATPGRVSLSVEDDGRGFDPSAVPGGRFGLVGMCERARMLGGELVIDAAPGRGTRAEAVIPLGASGEA